MGFDLRFHSGYHVTVPVKVLADSGGRLQVLMRVTSTADCGKPVFLGHRATVRDFPQGTKGEGLLTGGFDLGLGRYHVDWMMRDDRRRVCSSHWELEAKLGRGQRNLPLTLEPNIVAGSAGDPSADEPPVERDPAQPPHVKILLNLSPAKPQESILNPKDAMVLFSILRAITREPGISGFTLVAFDLRERKIFCQQENADKVDFDAQSKAV